MLSPEKLLDARCMTLRRQLVCVCLFRAAAAAEGFPPFRVPAPVYLAFAMRAFADLRFDRCFYYRVEPRKHASCEGVTLRRQRICFSAPHAFLHRDEALP